MRVVDLRSPAANLTDAYEQLELAWGNLKDVWGDTAMQAFEDNYISEIRPRVRMTLDAVTRLAGVLDQAQRACEPKKEQY